MELLPILLAMGSLLPSCLATETETPYLPRNLNLYCKICNSLSSFFDNLSYEDYDYWRTIPIGDKLRLFCSFCKKKTTEPTTAKTTVPDSMSTKAETTSQSPAETTTTVPTSLPTAVPPAPVPH